MQTTGNATDSMQTLFVRARANHLWFHSSYQNLWFSPDELEKCHQDGRFRWGPMNWTLRNPQELLKSAEGEVVAAIRRVEEIKKRMGI